MLAEASRVSRRSFFRKSAATTAVAAGGLVGGHDGEAIAQNVNTRSGPSRLKITDMRVARVGGRHVIRLDTNQDLSGYGEIRDGASPTYALMLKSRVLGMNPCNVDKIFRRLKQFGSHGRQAGGVTAVEVACWDLAGKAWGVPCWQMLGGKFRDRVRIYADCGGARDAVEMGNRLKSRMERGFTFLKMDFGIRQLAGTEGTVTRPPRRSRHRLAHPFLSVRITEKGLKIVQDYVATVRDIVGWEIPIAADHFGRFPVEDGIKLARALDRFNLAWLEDMVPWYYTDQHVRLKNSCNTPICTGEDIYLKEGFTDLFDNRAISICHPDLATSGGLLETKKIGDLAMEHGIAMALHMAGSPVALFASVHCAAATENFLALEHHSVGRPGYDELVTGVPKPIVGKDGFVPVPDGPGLGIELNEEAVKGALRQSEGEYFAPTTQWDRERSSDGLWTY